MLSGTWTQVTWKLAILQNLMKQIIMDLLKDGIEWKSQTIEMYGGIHSDICNVPLHPLSGVKIQIKFTKAKEAFFLISNKADSKVKYVFKEARLYVKRIRPNPAILSSHNEALLKGYPARYNFYQSRTQDLHIR